MGQLFDLYLATETLAANSKQLGLTVEELKRIQVRVSATLMQQPEAYLQLHYYVTLPLKSLASQLTWPKWQSDKVGFKDYLWEQTCLECFLAGCLINSHSEDNNNSSGTNKTEAYIEINASPNGQYALYEFDSYRYPSTLPPRPLLQADGQTRAFVDWIDGINNLKPLIDSTILIHKPYHYQRSFKVLLGSLTSLHLEADYCNDTFIEYIHPCVILSFGKTALYFAHKHASPPDFHNREYWARFDG